MIRLLWLPDKLRAYGLTVVEQPGWKTRGKPFEQTPRVALGHHTATSAKAPGDLPTLRILRDGRSDLPGPLCQVAVSRSGVAHVIAAGKANHAGKGAWAGITSSSLTVGCEVEHPGTGPWNPQQLSAFDRVMAALLDGLGRGASNYCGHREWALPRGRKIDPGGVDLDRQRHRIHGLLQAGPPRPARKPTPAPLEQPEEVHKVYVIFNDPTPGKTDDTYGSDGMTKFRFESQEAKNGWAALFEAKRKTVDLPTFDAIPTVERAL
jgi:hypothetical protein